MKGPLFIIILLATFADWNPHSRKFPNVISYRKRQQWFVFSFILVLGKSWTSEMDPNYSPVGNAFSTLDHDVDKYKKATFLPSNMKITNIFVKYQIRDLYSATCVHS